MQVKLMNAYASVPYRASQGAAGYDIAASENTEIPPAGQALVSTGLCIALPEGTYGRLAPRSGLSWKTHCTVGAGVIDQDYRGEVKVLIQNLSNAPLFLNRGQRVAQLIVEAYQTPDIVIVDQLYDTRRGKRGFGSTGMDVASDVTGDVFC